MLDSVNSFHIEPTNICTLQCPRCPRTEFIDTFKNKNWSNYNLNLEHLIKFLDIDLSNKKFVLNGNYGDPIYYDKLFDLIKFIKHSNAKVVIHTNGSYKTEAWWETLASLLDETDIVSFSIDGLPENFTQYRKNADWASIKQGIDIMVKSRAQIVWKYIVFSFNEHNIDQARQLSIDFEMDDFIVVNSDRWVDDDWLKPNKYANMYTNDRITYTAAHIGGRDQTIDSWKSGNRNLRINALCKETGSHFISANGFYMPCCWMGDYRFYYQTEFYKNKEMYDISKTTISKLLSNKNVIEFYNTLEDIKLKVCTFNCGKYD